MKSINKSKVFIIISFCVVFLIAAIISGFNLFYTKNTSSKKFSVENMVKHVEIISKEEHSVFCKEELDDVRNYIVEALNSYNVDNEMVSHGIKNLYNRETNSVEECEIKNIYAEIPGKSGVNVLLLAHFDSSPYKIKYGQVTNNSHGAFDDGYGVSTLLEIARVYAQENDLVNGIKLAFLDAEEVSLDGAYSLYEQNREWLNDVNVVINVESRGNTGPVYLFETSKNNSKLIDFYQNAGFPFSFSVAADVYSMMPNDTDLSVFLDNGFNCMNLATLDGLKYYHTEQDNFSNIDKNSLKAYGDTLFPLLEEYTQNNKYSKMDAFNSDHDAMFSTILPNVMLNLHPTVVIVLIVACSVITVALCVINKLIKKVKLSKILLSILFDILTLGVAFGIGFGSILLLCNIFNLKFNFMFVVGVPADKLILIVFALITFVLTLIINKLKNKFNIDNSAKMMSSLILFLILTIVSSIVLFSASIIFVIPTLLFVICAIVDLIKHKKTKMIMSYIFNGIASIITLSFFVLVVYSIFVSLSLGSLGVLLLLAALPCLLITPYILNTNQQ